MNKKSMYLIGFMFYFFVFPFCASASGSIAPNKGSISITQGGSSSFVISANNAAGKVSISSSNGSVASVSTSSGWLDNNSMTVTVTGNSPGSATINVTLSDAATYDEEELGNSYNIGVTVNPAGSTSTNTKSNNTSTAKKDTKSNNTKLEEFGVKDYKISPEFSNDKNDYTLTVPNDVNKIEIYAARNSDKQKVNGTGEKEVKEGENKFEVAVIAEDGTKRTINLTVTVDSKPIVVKIDNKDYTVIKNKDELPSLDIEHEDMTLTLEEQEVPAYRIDKLNYVLIGLKDNEGNINLYKFDSYKDDEKEPEYHLFKYLKTNGILFVRMDFPKNKIPKNYKKYTEEINGEKIEVYKLNQSSKYSLIYGINIETGKENIYRYDSVENTLQIFEREEAKKLEAKVLRREKLILILGGVIVMLVLFTTIGFTKKPKIKIAKETIESDDNLTKKDIKKIEKETKKQEKKNRKRQKKGEPDM